MFLKSFKTYAAILLCVTTFTGCGETQEQKINSFNYDKKDYLSISKACDDGYLNACSDKDEIDENYDAYGELCQKHEVIGACKRHFATKRNLGKACRFGDMLSCLVNRISYDFDSSDITKMNETIKTISDSSKSTYDKNLRYVAYLFLEDADDKKAMDYIYKFCRAGLVDWCFEIQNRTSFKDYSVLQTSYDVAKKECENDYSFCRISLRYAEIIGDIATQEQTLLTLAEKGVFLEPELMISTRLISLRFTDEYKNKLLKSLKKGCDLGSKTTCKMIGVLDDSKVTPTTKHDLARYIRITSKPLDKIDTSKITDMSKLFANSQRVDFSGIETWDTSNVVNMDEMFYEAIYFNHDISKWNTKNVVSMDKMFYGCENFNQPLDSWNVSSLRSANGMFAYAKSFNQPLGSWDVGSLESADSMFEYTESFDQPLGNWNVSKLRYANKMFASAYSFNQPLDSWNVGSLENAVGMFEYAKSFDQPLGSWDVSSLRFADGMFRECENFNQDLSSWDVSELKGVMDMFMGCKKFKQNLSTWIFKDAYIGEDMFYGTPMHYDKLLHPKTLIEFSKFHKRSK